MNITDINCSDCGNRIGRRRPDGQIIVRHKGRVVRAASCTAARSSGGRPLMAGLVFVGAAQHSASGEEE